MKFDLGQSSTHYPSGLHKKSIPGRGPVWVGQLMFSREKLGQFAVRMRYATHLRSAFGIQPGYPRSEFNPANIVWVFFFIIIKNKYESSLITSFSYSNCLKARSVHVSV